MRARRQGIRWLVLGATVTTTLLAGMAAGVSADPARPARNGDAAAAVLAPPTAAHPVVVRGATWLVRDTLSGGSATTTFTYGAVGDTPVSGDWDGNGSDTAGVVRGATWLLRNSNSGGPANISFNYGRPTDIPVVGDWDGNGTYTPGVVRGATWLLRNSNSGGSANVTFNYGRVGDTVVAGDWVGDRDFTPGVVRGTTWFLRNSNSGGGANLTFGYGTAGDRPVVGDWDANGSTTVGVIRKGTWLLRNANSSGGATVAFAYGRPCDVDLSTESALTRQWGHLPLKPSLVGTEMTKLPTGAKVVALTFDAGANANGIPKILSTLRSTCVPATFFLTGVWTRNFPQQTRDLGIQFPVGNHTNTHPHLTTLPDDQVRAQVLTAQSAIATATRYDPRPMFRFPFGESDARTLSIVNSLGYTSIRWTVDTLGWRGTSGGQSVNSVVARVVNALTPGEIVLMHVGSNPDDGSTLDADALPRVISELKARGYSFVTVPAYL